jgi:hypothetical protein
MTQQELVKSVLELCSNERLKEKAAHPVYGAAALRRLRALIEKLLKGRVLRGDDVASLWRDFTEWDAALPVDPPATLSISKEMLDALAADPVWGEELKSIRIRLSALTKSAEKAQQQPGRWTGGGSKVTPRSPGDGSKVTPRSLEPIDPKEFLATEKEKEEEREKDSLRREISSLEESQPASPSPKAPPPTRKEFSLTNERMEAELVRKMRGTDRDLGVDLVGEEFNRDIGVELPENPTDELELDTSRVRRPVLDGKSGGDGVSPYGPNARSGSNSRDEASPHPLESAKSVSLKVFAKTPTGKKERRYVLEANDEVFYVSESDMKALIWIAEAATKLDSKLGRRIIGLLDGGRQMFEPERGPSPKAFGLLKTGSGESTNAVLLVRDDVAALITAHRKFVGDIGWQSKVRPRHPIGKALLTLV